MKIYSDPKYRWYEITGHLSVGARNSNEHENWGNAVGVVQPITTYVINNPNDGE